MINLNDFIVNEHVRKTPRFAGEVNRTTRYRCYCNSCGKDRGYMSKSRYSDKPLCVKCSTNTCEHKAMLRKSHWTHRGLSPKNWMKKDPSTPLRIRIGCNLRSRLNKAIKGNFKSGSAVRDLGCSIDEFKAYIESKWQPGMSWDNWSRDGWHIDHIEPLCKFDLSNSEQLKQVCNYKNLQPLWAKDNLSKGNRLG